MNRKRFSEEQIIGILQEAQKGVKTIGELCRAHGVSEPTFYTWRRKYETLSCGILLTCVCLRADLLPARRTREIYDMTTVVVKGVVEEFFGELRECQN